ncbi:MAG TPA: hypothetical protein VHA30_05220 [Patescibacteria group bacterium]|nr:hypothetical protein [Patescibacteria group bacterium]
MIILQLLFAAGALGLAGFGLYWLGVVLGIGPKVEQNQIDRDKRL